MSWDTSPIQPFPPVEGWLGGAGGRGQARGPGAPGGQGGRLLGARVNLQPHVAIYGCPRDPDHSAEAEDGERETERGTENGDRVGKRQAERGRNRHLCVCQRRCFCPGVSHSGFAGILGLGTRADSGCGYSPPPRPRLIQDEIRGPRGHLHGDACPSLPCRSQQREQGALKGPCTSGPSTAGPAAGCGYGAPSWLPPQAQRV